MQPLAAAELLSAVARVFERLGLQWYVFGAQAVVAYGRPRLTEDVDVTVALGDLDVQILVNELVSSGFELSVAADDEFIAATRVLPFSHAATGMALDIVLAGPGLEEIFVAEAQMLTLGGVEVPVIRLEHLLVTKVLAGRPKDLDDATEILRARCDDIELDVVRDLLVDLERALGQSDLVPILDQLLRAV